MKYIYFILCLFYMGCAGLDQSVDPSIPHLLFQNPLPPLPESLQRPPDKISMMLFISKDGTVTNVRLILGSGIASWDSLAVSTIMRWQFVPARMNDKPVGAWFHMEASILYTIPEYCSLAEIVHHEKKVIDSIYTALIQGQDFSELATNYSTSPSRQNNGVLGKVNIYSYPNQIRRHLTHLKVDEFTKPLQYGEIYIIFKRIKE